VVASDEKGVLAGSSGGVESLTAASETGVVAGMGVRTKLAQQVVLQLHRLT
jgi:hypothetical protein